MQAAVAKLSTSVVYGPRSSSSRDNRTPRTPRVPFLACRHTVVSSPKTSRLTSVVTAATKGTSETDAIGTLSGIARYLSEAATAIFSTPTSDVNWEGTASPFTGKITHHERERVHKLLKEIGSTKEKILGCMDPAALNFNPEAEVDSGACEYAPGSEPESELQEYVTTSIKRVFAHNFKGDDTEPDWKSTGIGFSGDILRNQRSISKLMRYEKFLKRTLKDVDETKN